MAHNSIYRGANLGTISSLNEYLAFRTAHGIDDKSYKNLYIGDYVKIQDGTYNATWTVTHFDYYSDKGSSYGFKGVVLSSIVTTSKMNDTNTTVGGYKASIVHTTALPAITNALELVLGTYLHSINSYFLKR